MRRTAVLFAVLALTGCSSDKHSTRPTTTGKAAADVSYLVQRIEEIHPDPWHAISEADFKAAAMGLEGKIAGLNPDEQLVELMRLMALLGERDGHSGIFPLDAAHERTPHLYPLRLYEFSDGVFVVDTIDQPELVGARVVSIAGRPVEEVLDAVRPLVPADNEMSRGARVAQYIVVEEVLRGLGFTGSNFGLDGETLTLAPVKAHVYAAAFEDLFHPMVPQGFPAAPNRPTLLAGSRSAGSPDCLEPSTPRTTSHSRTRPTSRLRLRAPRPPRSSSTSVITPAATTGPTRRCSRRCANAKSQP
jgi:hypothetical protein